jgi:hypothetical protein
MTDKGADAKANREAARERGICPVIPYRSNTKDRPAFFPRGLYRRRARIEQAIGKLKPSTSRLCAIQYPATRTSAPATGEVEQPRSVRQQASAR